MFSLTGDEFNMNPKFCAVVRQCVFYEKYGGCKFGKDCFYAHNDEMTLGVRVRVYLNFLNKIKPLGLMGPPRMCFPPISFRFSVTYISAQNEVPKEILVSFDWA